MKLTWKAGGLRLGKLQKRKQSSDQKKKNMKIIRKDKYFL